MFYAWNILLSSGGSAAGKTKQVLQLAKGVITRTEFIFPTGCAALVSCTLNDALHQVYPANPDLAFTGDGEKIEITDEYSMQFEPYQLQFYGWNTDETYDHTVTIRLLLIPRSHIFRVTMAEVYRLSNLSRPE
jgi:hypothetical protein